MIEKKIISKIIKRKTKKRIDKKIDDLSIGNNSKDSSIDWRKRRFIENSIKVAPFLSLLTTASSCEEEETYSVQKEKPYVPGSEKWQDGEEKFLKTACGQCQVSCGILVRVVEGRAVKVIGNPKSSPNRGIVGPKGQTSVFALYDPDRIKLLL